MARSPRIATISPRSPSDFCTAVPAVEGAEGAAALAPGGGGAPVAAGGTTTPANVGVALTSTLGDGRSRTPDASTPPPSDEDGVAPTDAETTGLGATATD